MQIVYNENMCIQNQDEFFFKINLYEGYIIKNKVKKVFPMILILFSLAIFASFPIQGHCGNQSGGIITRDTF